MSFGAVIGAVGVIGGAAIASRGSRKAGEAAASASDAAVAEQGRQFDIIRDDTAPYRQIGTQALNTLGSIYGYSPYETAQPVPGVTEPLSFEQWSRGQGSFNTGGGIAGLIGAPIRATQNYQQYVQGFQPQQQPASTPNTAPDYSAFFKSPDYEFRRGEGMRGIENSFAARGGAASGNALRALTQYNSGLASGEFGNFFNRQASLAGIGQTAVQQSGNAGMQAAGNIGNALIAGGNARASGIAGQANAIGAGLSGLGQGLGYWMANRQQAPNFSGWGSGANLNNAWFGG